MTHYFEHLEAQLKAAWRRPVLSDYGSSSYTGHDIAENIALLHLLFRKAGLAKGEKIALYGNNSAHWGMAVLSVNTYGAVAVPLLSDFRPADASSLARHAEAKILFVQKNVWAQMDPASMPSLLSAVSLEDYSILWSSCMERGELLEVLCSEYDAACPYGFSPGMVHYEPGEGTDLAVINYTSGTTSAPKGVMLTYDNFNTNLEYALYKIPPRMGDQLVSMLPLAHMYGFMFELLYPICGGVHIHFLGKTPTPALLSKALRDVRPYLLITVPLVMEKIFKSSVHPVISKPVMKMLMSLPGVSSLLCTKIRGSLISAFGGRVREIVMGGAALNPEVEHWFKKIGLPYTVGYGMTEASPLMAYEDWDKYAPGSCGKAVDRCEVRIDSSDPRNIAGEIQARGMNIMKGYYKNEKATADAFTEDGWLRTGDLGVIDSEGNIFIRGRSKNMILSSNGQNIYPEELEAVINAMPNVQESLVVPRGNGLTALVYTGDTGRPFTDEDLQKVNSKLPSYSRISAVEPVSAPFEKTPKQSIKRFLYS